MGSNNVVRVAMAGCGTVGCGVGDLLIRDHDLLMARSGFDFRLVHVLVRDAQRSRAPHVPDELLTIDPSVLWGDDVDVVVEVIGGTDLAREIVLRALSAGKDMVTANKALLALHGPEVYTAACRAGVGVGFEASCAAGLPVIAALQRGLAANRIESFAGILNGTCNFILHEMLRRRQSFADALAEAQRRGYAEADPTLDLNGTDTAHKLAILASLAFDEHPNFADIPVAGIEHLALADLLAAETWGLACKLVGLARRQDDGFALRVEPVLLEADHPLAHLDGHSNGVVFRGHAVGEILVAGLGAGGPSTASGVVADLVETALGNVRRTFAQVPLFHKTAVVPVVHADNGPDQRFYLRPTCGPSGEAGATDSTIERLLREQGITVERKAAAASDQDAPSGRHHVLLTAPAPRTTMAAAVESLHRALDLSRAPVWLPVLGAVSQA